MRKNDSINFEIEELNNQKEKLETNIENINKKIEELKLELNENNFYSMAYKYKDILLKMKTFLEAKEEIKKFYIEDLTNICNGECDRDYFSAYDEKICPLVPICAYFCDEESYLEELKEIFEKIEK